MISRGKFVRVSSEIPNNCGFIPLIKDHYRGPKSNKHFKSTFPFQCKHQGQESAAEAIMQDHVNEKETKNFEPHAGRPANHGDVKNPHERASQKFTRIK